MPPDPSASPSFTPAALTIVAAGAAVMAISIGVRATLGVFVLPLSMLHHWPVSTFSLALAVHNLLWGLVQPLVGGLADRHGARPVIVAGSLFYAGGLLLTAGGSDPAAAMLGAGLAVGLGLSAASFPVVLALVGRAVPADRRSLAMGLAIAGGSLGQVILPPLGGVLIEGQGVTVALVALAAITLAMAPLALLLTERRPADAAPLSAPTTDSVYAPLAAAWKSGAYRLVVIGFFACGFQLAFISIHLPGHLSLCGMPPGAGANALALMGLFNVAGCWICGSLGSRYSLPRLLAILYGLRAIAVAGFLAVPLSEASLIGFSALTGFTWLATVPLTSALIAHLFGPRDLGLLFGTAFLSHQLGSFLGVWAGGWAFDLTGSYQSVWAAAGALGLIAAILHAAISDRPVFTPRCRPPEPASNVLH
ncbi:MFS transporter [Magnetospirillum fulvum]|uniref:Predicted arabinose efflux permease, MFS family n=1 Tax=Magnetospirillum fulvum TaxID=1082 RepID=A0A1H6HFQ5_MAGFU|nr:MFS transporter [Magnetospirillum fulvum]SEH33942.1 Predicted arabinose efflux permease, MFS family [Magnetospirillum fulvum]